MPYRVELTPRADRQLRRLPAQLQSHLLTRIRALAAEPRPQGIKKLVGEEGVYRLRVGDYRIVYMIQDAVLVVLIVGIGHRREVYRRYM